MLSSDGEWERRPWWEAAGRSRKNRPGKILSPSRQEIKTGKYRSPTVSDGPAVLTRDERVRALNGLLEKVNAKGAVGSHV